MIKRVAPKTFMASFFDFGSIMAESYLPEAITLKMIVIAEKIAKTPKSSGEYSLVKIGLTIIGIACAIEVPVNIVSTFLPNSDLSFNRLNNYSFSQI